MSWEQVGAALVVAVPSTTIGVMAYLRSKKVDATSAQSGAANDTRAGTAQIIEGLNKLIDQLQEGASTFREDIQWLTARLDAVMKENETLKTEIVRYKHKYGNGI